MKLFKKTLVDLIPGLAFTFATIISINSHNSFIGLGCYIIAFMTLTLHTYLINKIDEE